MRDKEYTANFNAAAGGRDRARDGPAGLSAPARDWRPSGARTSRCDVSEGTGVFD